MNTKWGVYPWFIEHGVDLIHPDDIEAFRREANNSKVFECIEDGDFLTLKYNTNCYRVSNRLFKPVPNPQYVFEQVVIIRENGEEATITDIMWHYGKKEHYYMVSINNKKRAKRYLASEFV